MEGNGNSRYKNRYAKDVAEIRLQYKKKFLEILKGKIQKEYGRNRASSILKALQNKSILVENSEVFYELWGTYDPSFEIYSKSETPQEFFLKIFNHFETLERSGCSYIKIRELLLVMSDMLARKDVEFRTNDLKSYMYYLMQKCLTYENKPVYDIQIIDRYLRTKVSETFNLDMSRFGTVLRLILEISDEYQKHISVTKMPLINLIFGVYEDSRDLQIRYLMETFTLKIDQIEKYTKNIPDLSQDNAEVRTLIELLKSERNLPKMETDLIIRELQIRGKEKIYKSFFSERIIKYDLRLTSNMGSSYMEKYGIGCIFSNAEMLLQSMKNCEINNVLVNCQDKSKIVIENLIGMARDICLSKKQSEATGTNKILKNKIYKITLLNATEYNENFTEEIRKKAQALSSMSNNRFIIEINYDPETAREKIHFTDPDCIRVISDIHIDYNEKHNYQFDFGNDFVINCGDTAGNASTAYAWIETHMRKGVVVAGNHLGYSPSYPELNGAQNLELFKNVIHKKNTKTYQMKELSQKFKKSEVSFLTNKVREYNGLTILGTTLFTNFKLYGEEHMEECMAYAKKYMNDFRNITLYPQGVYTLTENGWNKRWLKEEEKEVRLFTPYDHLYFFHHSYKFLKWQVGNLKVSNKPVVIVTHHAPSPYSIDEKYKGDLLNAAFVSNLNKFIIRNPHIRLWVHGHCHSSFDYILGETRVVCEPFGYNNENNRDLPANYGKRIAISDILSTESWRSILRRDIEKGEIQVYDE